MLDAELKVHLRDFGLAWWMDHHKLDKTTMTARTLGYMAPEMPYIGKATKESHVYSFGMLVLEVISGRHPLDMHAVEPEDLVLLYSVLQAHEGGALQNVGDPRLLQRLQRSKSVLLQDDMPISATKPLYLLSGSHNLTGSNIPISVVVDVDVEAHKTTIVDFLRLGLLC